MDIYVLYDETTRKIKGIASTDVWKEEDIPTPKIIIDENTRQSICSNGYNYISENGVPSTKDFRTVEEIAEQEILAKLPSSKELEKTRIELVALDLILTLKEEGAI